MGPFLWVTYQSDHSKHRQRSTIGQVLPRDQIASRLEQLMRRKPHGLYYTICRAPVSCTLLWARVNSLADYYQKTSFWKPTTYT